VSKNTADVINEVVQTVSDIIKNNDLPELPIDRNPPIGDFALICFPAAKVLKKILMIFLKKLLKNWKKMNG